MLFLFFTLRDTFIQKYYPGLKEHYLEWDGANIFTMNIFALMFSISFIITRILLELLNWKTCIFVIDVLLGISIADLTDRFNNNYFRSKEDCSILIFTILITGLWLLATNIKSIIFKIERPIKNDQRY